ncbi:MAG: D-alanine--D-alanine ligase [Oscillospiraceae bacterium]|nr:D-alanine--D-alanine ligase [Oscillospiraceae bacterium]
MKIRIALLFGGKSVEHEVSIITALQAAAAFDRDKYEIIPIYISKDSRMFVGDAVGDIKEYRDTAALISKSTEATFARQSGKVCLIRLYPKAFTKSVISEIDVAFPAVHGTNVEDGTLQGYLQFLDIPYAGSGILGSAVGMDKYASKCVLRAAGIQTLYAETFRSSDYIKSKDSVIKQIVDNVGLPTIIKPVNLGSSVGIMPADSVEELEEALDNAFLFTNDVMAERCVKDLREINCAVLGDSDEAEASECEEPFSSGQILSYDDKYKSGGKGKSGGKQSGMASLARKIPADISPELREKIRETSVLAFKKLGCSGVARLDFILEGDNLYLNEINTIPGSLAFYLFEPIGVKYKTVLDKMVTLALKRERERQSVNFSFDTNLLQTANFGVKGSKR